VIRIVEEAIDVGAMLAALADPRDGAQALFLGVVRDHHEGRSVKSLAYEAYGPMARTELEKIRSRALAQFEIRDLAVVHRVGPVAIGEAAVAVLAVSAHREPAFDACRFAMDAIKASVPIFKKEHYADGSRWIEGGTRDEGAKVEGEIRPGPAPRPLRRRGVFLGTGSFAVAALERLLRESSGDRHGRDGDRDGDRGGDRDVDHDDDRRPGVPEIVGVVTQPDRPRGRGRKVVPGEVARMADEHGLPVLKADEVNDPASLEWIRELRPDLLAVVDFGQYLGKRVREVAPRGAYNLHPSLLPRHRGASPVPYTILAGDRWAGVCVQRVVREMDAGPIVGRVAVPVRPAETAGELAERLRPIAAELFATVLSVLDDARPEPQDPELATAAPKLGREDRRVDFARPADEVARRIRAMSPKPGVAAFLSRAEGPPLRVTLLRAVPAASADPADAAPSAGSVEPSEASKRADAGADVAPGTVLSVEGGRLVVAAGDGAVSLGELKPAGKGAMSAESFVRGYRPRRGDVFTGDEPVS